MLLFIVGLLLGNLDFKRNKRARLIIQIIKYKRFGFIFEIIISAKSYMWILFNAI